MGRPPVNRQLSVQQHRPWKSSSVVILSSRGHNSSLETPFKWHFEVIRQQYIPEMLQIPGGPEDTGLLRAAQHHASEQDVSRGAWNPWGHFMYNVFCLKVVLSHRMRDSGYIYKKRETGKEIFRCLRPPLWGLWSWWSMDLKNIWWNPHHSFWILA